MVYFRGTNIYKSYITIIDLHTTTTHQELLIATFSHYFSLTNQDQACRVEMVKYVFLVKIHSDILFRLLRVNMREAMSGGEYILPAQKS